MSKRVVSFLVLVSMIIVLGFFSIYPQENKKFNRDLLIQDTRQLAQIFETAHPDPYIRGGGKIAFHRRLQDTLRAIPEDGMIVKEFYKLLLPFVAALGDGHTGIFLSQMQQPSAPGFPLGLGIVDNCLYITTVYDKNLRQILGANLISLEGVSFAELIKRQRSLNGWDNEYHNLANLCRNLRTRDGLEALLPEWKDVKNIRARLKPNQGEEKDYIIALPEKILTDSITPSSKIQLPSVEKIDFGYDFLDVKKKTALLRIDGMFSFRENFEYFNMMGVEWVKQYAARTYEKFHRASAPAKLEETIAGIPSATETFRSLVIDMRRAATETLVIDLRKNGGGNSVMGYILSYFLYGNKTIESQDRGYSIKKYSDLYFSEYTGDNLEKINAGRTFALMKDDYDFKGELNFFDKNIYVREQKKENEEYLKMMPTFMEEVKTRKYDGFYLPEKVMVVCSPGTYSSGYDLAVLLYKLGAILVGVPSSQAGNCFGDVLMFRLNNTGIRGQVSFKYMLAFPTDPEKGRVLRPHFELTYKKLASYRFDPNAEVLLALEVAGKQERK
jgi:hypothetical protein